MSLPIARIRDWLTMGETIAALGKSASTVERLVGSGRIKSQLEPRPGRKPERMYSAGDVERLKQQDDERSGNVSVPFRRAPQGPTQLAISADTVSSIREMLTEWKNPPKPKLWLNLEEACAYSGLGVSALLAAVAEGKIAGGKYGPHGALAVHRASLEEYRG